MKRGTALLSVLLIVAVMAAIAATALDRLGVATNLSANANNAAQSRAWLSMAEEIAMRRLETGGEAAGGNLSQYLDVTRTIDLPDGQAVAATLRDQTNCFNVNGLVRQRSGSLVIDTEARRQFEALIELLGASASEAATFTAQAIDFMDGNSTLSPNGSETLRADVEGRTAPAPNRLMASASELALLQAATPELLGTLAPFVCALPDTDLPALNIETLRPDQAPLLSMLSPAEIPLSLAAAHLAARPAGGYGSVYDFWNKGLLAGRDVPTNASGQLRVESRYFRLETAVDQGDYAVRQTALIEWRGGTARRVARSWGDTL